MNSGLYTQSINEERKFKSMLNVGSPRLVNNHHQNSNAITPTITTTNTSNNLINNNPSIISTATNQANNTGMVNN